MVLGERDCWLQFHSHPVVLLSRRITADIDSPPAKCPRKLSLPGQRRQSDPKMPHYWTEEDLSAIVSLPHGEVIIPPEGGGTITSGEERTSG
jgi:hypothetical protein